jgi:hypothetical protein
MLKISAFISGSPMASIFPKIGIFLAFIVLLSSTAG